MSVVQRRKRIRSMSELLLALRASNCRVYVGTPYGITPLSLEEKQTAGDITRLIETRRLWAVTYHTIGGSSESHEGGRNGTDKG